MLRTSQVARRCGAQLVRGTKSVSPLAAQAPLIRAASTSYEISLAVTGANHIGAGGAASGIATAANGIGLCWLGLQTATARQPALADQFFAWAMIGFAFCEATGLLAFVVAMILIFAV
eukprot:TRINITY_DN51717_c0_g1_i2.p1 TRINITY_DN51717_c0_g1~~TRINITY_DN51717_c0_g1_i2.p1  ORF type:complete len:118 (-),score=12.46 TRINITY_DN51717_c0_g1_i2:222-575(-)